MTCSTCGNILAQDARFCPRCGAPVASAPPPGPVYTAMPPAYPYAPAPYTRVATHVQVLAILWLVYAGVRALSGLIGLLVFHGIFGHAGSGHWMFGWDSFGNSAFGNSWIMTLWPIILTSLLVSIGCCVLTGVALLTRQPWARILAIIFSILALIHPLLGTALGIYTLWVLAPTTSGLEYAALSARPPHA